jgi:hypothetical protein
MQASIVILLNLNNIVQHRPLRPANRRRPLPTTASNLPCASNAASPSAAAFLVTKNKIRPSWGGGGVIE